jgi:hypothetical protein
MNEPKWLRMRFQNFAQNICSMTVYGTEANFISGHLQITEIIWNLSKGLQVFKAFFWSFMGYVRVRINQFLWSVQRKMD